MSDLIFIKQFGSIAEAELTKNMLMKYGIISILRNSGINYGGDLGDSFGAELLVKTEDFNKAKEILGLV